MHYYYVDAKQLKALLKLEMIATGLQIAAPIVLLVLLNMLFDSSFSWLIFLLPLLIQETYTVPLYGADKKYLQTHLLKMTDSSLSGTKLGIDFNQLLSVEAVNAPVSYGLLGNLLLKRYYPERLVIATTAFNGARTEIDVTLLKRDDRLHLLEQLETQVNINRENTHERS